MVKSLPPLNTLLAFSTAAKLNSFKLAAVELNLTPAAVAYQIKKLEEYLNVELFIRQHKGVELNKAGQNYYDIINSMLNELQTNTEKLRVEFKPEALNILTLHAIAQHWLMPRLADFRMRHPQVTIQINATDNLANSSAEDLVIGFSVDAQPKANTVALMSEDIFPVCSASYLRSQNNNLSLNQLTDYDVLIDLHWKKDWQMWLNQNSARLKLQQSRTLSFSLYSLVIDAAVNGMGIMMGHRRLIQDELKSGTLKKIFKQTKPLIGYYYLEKNPNLTDNHVASLFQDWLLIQTQ